MELKEFKQFVESLGEIYLFGGGVVGYYTAKWIVTHTSAAVKKILVTAREGNVDYYGGISVQTIDELEEKESFIIIATLEALHGQIKHELLRRGFRNIYGLPENIYHKIRNTDLDMGMEWYQHFCRESVKFENFMKEFSKIFNNGIRLYRDTMDQHLYRDQWRERRKDKLFYEKLHALTDRLETGDTEEIYRIIHRLHLLCEDEPVVYSKEEGEILDRIEENFYKKIYKISSDRFVYKNYFLPMNHFEESVFWYEHGIKLLENPEYILNKDAIDAGAFIGDSALVMSNYIKGNIYSFEADQENYGYLKRTLEMNEKNNIIPVNLALSDHVGELNLYAEKEAPSVQSNHSVMEKNSLLEPVRKTAVFCTTIDEYVKSRRLRVGLIKTDVEGCERNLLNGAVHTIMEQKPSMIISIYHNLDDFFEIKPWIEGLNLGYSFKIFRPVIKHSFMTETMLICEAKNRT